MRRVLDSGGTVVHAFLAVILVLSTACAGAAWSQDQAPAGQPSEQEMMKQMMELAAPGEQHEELGRLVGTWRTKNTMWMGGPEPMVSSGNSTYEWILGGRYLQSRHVGQWSGMPFEWMGIDGYDKAKQEYFTLWFDNMGTGMMKLTGKKSADGKGITFTGTTFDPAQGRDISVREEVVWTDDRHYTFTMYMLAPGPDGQMQEMKAMEIAAEKQ